MRIKNLLFSATVMLAGLSANSQDLKKQQDIKAIKSMCGCYEVKFNFAETFMYPKDSASYKPSQTKHETGLEWVQLVEDKPNKISLQHLLIIGKTEKDIIKHWRQDWLFENTDLYLFDKDLTWKYKKLAPKEVKGQWTQKVFQVDDSPRYEGTATWVHYDGRDYWENTTDAPLPRREYTKRNDYNVLKRTNVHEIKPFGWIHDQDNEKLIRTDGQEDVLLAQEKGHDVYTKVADSKCEIAQKWWAENQVLWQKVRTKWQAVFAKDKTLSMEKKVDGKNLYEFLFDLDPKATQEEVDKIIDGYIKK